MHSFGLYSTSNPLRPSTEKDYKTIPVYFISMPAIFFIVLTIWRLCDPTEPFLEKLDFFLYAISLTQSVGAFLNLRFHMDQMTTLQNHLQSMVNAQGWLNLFCDQKAPFQSYSDMYFCLFVFYFCSRKRCHTNDLLECWEEMSILYEIYWCISYDLRSDNLCHWIYLHILLYFDW